MTDKQNEFKISLKRKLAGKLPGLQSQLKMIPEIRRKEIESYSWNQKAKKSAVLICFYPDNPGDIHLILIKRNEYDGVHSGQISFPGGQFEKSDPDLTYTALREAEEETNIQMESVEVLGEMTPVYIPPSNFIVKPVVGWCNEKPDLKPEPAEVSQILCIPLYDLLNPENMQNRNISHREFNIIDVPCFYIQNHIIWGATAMMLREVVDVLDTGY